MSNDHKKADDKNAGMNAGVAAVAGAVVGAGLAVAGTIAMQNPDNQEKVKNVVDAAKEHATDYLTNAGNMAEDKKEEISKKVEEATKKG